MKCRICGDEIKNQKGNSVTCGSKFCMAEMQCIRQASRRVDKKKVNERRHRFELCEI